MLVFEKQNRRHPEVSPVVYLRFPLEAGFLTWGFFAGADRLAGAFGGGVFPPCRGGIARIRHLGPEPIRSSLCAFSKASLTR